ncbi:pyrethroid hydrolase Ces2e-like [Clavelina lepadiformis]|uniref:pyrethroid hydrolase Ces2e-like n=1 Tax=Clavelina lepadiformis TaxID=159417 RepID=UPI004042C60E
MNNMSEDCLYLSIYTSKPSEHGNLPVVFWIDGGGYCSFGFASQGTTNGNILCSTHDVILVVANYRVGAFGFLTTGDGTSHPGNMGFLDQLAALEWTRDNIREFGGNPDNVTIIGQGTGAVSVGYHVISPMSRGLFHKAVSMSGSANMTEIVRTTQSTVLDTYKEELGVEDDDPDAILQKLKKIPLETLKQVQEKLEQTFIQFGPAVDGKFLPKHPSELLNEGKLSPVPYLIGCVDSETSGISSMAELPDFVEGISEEVGRSIYNEYFMGLFPNQFTEDDLNIIVESYVKKQRDGPTKWSQIYANLSSDAFFIAPMVMLAKKHSGGGHPTYAYYMTQQLKYNHDLAFGSKDTMKPEFCNCDHCDDILFTFGIPLSEESLNIDTKFDEAEKSFSRAWMMYIVNFATNGDPNKGLKVSETWPRYNADGQKYLVAQMPLASKSGLGAESCSVWEKYKTQMKRA